MKALLRGLVAAVLLVVPGAALAQRAKGKPIVAVYEMQDLAKTGQAETFSTMIETAIAATSKFRVIERSRLGTLVGEQGRAKAGLVTSNTPGKIGGFEGADFLIYGTITTAAATKKADIGSTMLAGLFSRQGQATPTCSNAVVTLAIDIKITDAATGEVKYVTRINETQKSAASCGGEAQVDTANLMRSAADKVATGLVTTIYPIQIASVTADGVVLNYGEGAVAPGSVMAVYAKGAAVIDPATGEAIGNDEVKLGFIRVTEINGRISKAVLASPFAGAPVIGSIVRPATTADLQALNRQGKRR